MRSVLVWTAAGVVVPAALVLGPLAIGLAVSGQLEDLPGALGYAPLVLLMTALPGALAGLVLGIVDHWLKRYVVNGTAAAPRRRPVVAALGLFALLAVAVNSLLAITVTDMADGAVNLALSAAVAAIPAVISYVRYTRIGVDAGAPDPPARSGAPAAGR